MKHPIFAALGISLLLAGAAANAQQPAPSALVYNFKMSTGPGSGMNLSLAVNVSSTATDGSRKARITVHMPQMPPLDGKQMDATISPAGAISIGSTGEMPKNYSPTQIAAASAAMSGPMVQQFINPLNTFAAAVAAAPSQTTGTSWHALSPEQIDVVYTITGRQAQSGHDTLAVKMASPSGNGPSISGQGNYDPSAHLVVTLHSEVRQSPGGPSSITDVALGS